MNVRAVALAMSLLAGAEATRAQENWNELLQERMARGEPLVTLACRRVANGTFEIGPPGNRLVVRRRRCRCSMQPAAPSALTADHRPRRVLPS